MMTLVHIVMPVCILAAILAIMSMMSSMMSLMMSLMLPMMSFTAMPLVLDRISRLWWCQMEALTGIPPRKYASIECNYATHLARNYATHLARNYAMHLAPPGPMTTRSVMVLSLNATICARRSRRAPTTAAALTTNL